MPPTTHRRVEGYHDGAILRPAHGRRSFTNVSVVSRMTPPIPTSIALAFHPTQVIHLDRQLGDDDFESLPLDLLQGLQPRVSVQKGLRALTCYRAGDWKRTAPKPVPELPWTRATAPSNPETLQPVHGAEVRRDPWPLMN
jgi:hypothetical protein